MGGTNHAVTQRNAKARTNLHRSPVRPGTIGAYALAFLCAAVVTALRIVVDRMLGVSVHYILSRGHYHNADQRVWPTQGAFAADAGRYRLFGRSTPKKNFRGEFSGLNSLRPTNARNS